MKFNKLKTCFAAATLITCMTASNIFAASQVSVKVDGLLQPMNTESINRDGNLMVGMEDIFTVLGADVNWNEYKREVTAKKGNTTVIISTDTGKASVNGKEVELPVNCEIVDGILMVPLRFVSESLNAAVSWDETGNTVNIKTDSGNYILLEEPVPAETDKVLTYEEALEMAKKKNSNIKNLKDSADYLEELRDDLTDTLRSLDSYGSVSNNYPLDGPPVQTEDYTSPTKFLENASSIIDVARNIKSVDLQESALEINEEMLNDGIEAMLKSSINSIKQTEMNISLLEKTIEIGNQDIENMELKHSLGYESDYSLETAKIQQKSKETDLENLKLSLKTQKESLKNLLRTQEDVFIEYDITFNALDDVNLETYIMRKKQSDPSIVVLKNNVEVAQYTKNTASGKIGEMQVKVDNDLKKAQRELSDAQSNMEKNITAAYNQIKQLEQKNKSLKLALDKAKADYNSVVASFQVGNATVFDVNKAKIAILSAEKDIEENALNYDNLVFTFYRPYLLSSGSAQ